MKIGNIGLRDRTLVIHTETITQYRPAKECFALESVHKYVAAFGGKPDQISMYAAISTCLGC